MSKRLLSAMLTSVLVVVGASRAEADNETIQYTIRCETQRAGNGNGDGDDFRIDTDALFASDSDATLCRIDHLRRGRCCRDNMQAVADALEGERSVVCVRTVGREDDDSQDGANGDPCCPCCPSGASGDPGCGDCASGQPCCEDEDATVKTTCRASDVNHGKAVLAACQAAVDLEDCDIK